MVAWMDDIHRDGNYRAMYIYFSNKYMGQAGGEKMSEHDMLYRELKQAQQNFDYADEKHKSKAIYDLMYAEMRYNQYMNERRIEIERNLQELNK